MAVAFLHLSILARMTTVLMEELQHELNESPPNVARVIDLVCLLDEPEARRDLARSPQLRSLYSELQGKAERLVLSIDQPTWNFDIAWQVGRKRGCDRVRSFTRHVADALRLLWRQLCDDGKIDLTEVDSSAPVSAQVLRVWEEEQ